MAVYANLNFHINNPIILGLLLVVQIPKKCILHLKHGVLITTHLIMTIKWLCEIWSYFSIKLKRVALPGTKVCIFYFKSRLSLIVQVKVVLNRTVVVDSDWCFDNLCGSHLYSQSELYHVSWWYYTLVFDLIGQLCRDVIACEDS